MHVFNIITGKNKSLNHLVNDKSCKYKCKLDEKNVFQITVEITIAAYMSVRSAMYAKEIIFGTLLHVVVKTENIQQVLRMIQQFQVMKLWMLNDAEAKSNDETKSNNEETNII